MSDDLTVIAVLRKLSAAFPRFELQEDTIAIYEECLQDIPPEILKVAALHIISEAQFFPAVSEFRKVAFDFLNNKHDLPSPYEAWEEVLLALDEGIGLPPYRDKKIDVHPLIVRAVKQIGGWRHLSLSNNLSADRARFLQAYEEAVERRCSDKRMLPE